MKVVIVSGGDAPSYELIKNELKESSFLICADSGGNCLYKYNLVPNYLMGDFDSINSKVLEFFKKSAKCIIETYPRDKDFTDTQLVLNKALELGGTEIVFLGCTGTRIDHLMGSLGMLLKCLKLNVNAYIRDEHNYIRIVDKPIKIKGKKGETFSLHCYGESVENLSIKGAKYELQNYCLKIGDPRTVSNEFLEGEVEISFTSGNLMLFYSKD
ncbi:thiamine diphosphokinase [Clostridium sp. P21]|uniref:Thiamine diphosphokinase n=1 Tax=Clostridium muellerianum TaxID=2716538 RepID=A0A7Y0HRW3_9CLOT|nr:thiamine diphosphokinase [Clostridium muellerianum]NMM65641.1 thiamine diphosphokinase [Clostridium muellerianum]